MEFHIPTKDHDGDFVIGSRSATDPAKDDFVLKICTSSDNSTVTRRRSSRFDVSCLTLDTDLLTTVSGHSDLKSSCEKLVLRPHSDSKKRQSDRMASINLQMCQLRFGNLPLFGRQAELKKLRDVVDAVHNNGKKSDVTARGLILLPGLSGSGKTTLALEVEPMMKRRKGFFAASKCEDGIDEPFAGIEDTMDALCRQILLLPLRHGQEEVQEESSYTNGTATTRSFYSQSTRSSTTLGPSWCLEDVRDKLAAQLEDLDKEVLLPALPALCEILGVPPAKQHFGGGESKDDTHLKKPTAIVTKDATTYKEDASKLQYAYRHLLRIVSSICPVTLFLDDCQWADPVSLAWIKSVVTESNHANTNADEIMAGSVLVVACYRSEEVDETHELCKMESSLLHHRPTDSPGFVFERIPVEGLTVEHVINLLLELFSMNHDQDMEDCAGLARLLHQKTHGNAFFVVQLVRQMQEDELLYYNLAMMKWQWVNLGQIHAKYQATDNVAHLTQLKLQNHKAGLKVLPVAACLGSNFSSSALRRVLKELKSAKAAESTEEQEIDEFLEEDHLALQECLDDGLLEVTKGDRDSLEWEGRFVHDKIREAALVFADDDLKISVGEVLLKLISTEADVFGDFVYAATPLLDLIKDKLEFDDPKRQGIIEMNGLAGRKALECSAFDIASTYLKTALDLIEANPFSQDNATTTDIYTMAAASHFVTGKMEDATAFCNNVLERDDVPLLDQVASCYTIMDIYESTVNTEESYRVGKKMLKKFGRRFPKSSIAIVGKTLSGLIKTKLKLKKQLSPQELEKQEISKDPKTLATMRLLDKFASAVYRFKPDMLPLALMESTKASEQLGLNPYSGAAYAFMGLLFAGVFEDFETAKICGEAGVQIMNRSEYPAMNSRTLMLAYGLCIHWSTPLKDCLKGLRDSYEWGMKTGQLTSECAFGGIHFYVSFCFWSGMNLNLVYKDYTIYMNQMEELGSKQAFATTAPNRQIVTRLRGTPDEMDEAGLLEFARERNDPVIECFIRWSEIYIACLFGDHEKGATISLEWVPKIMKLVAGMNVVLETVFASALCSMAVIRKTGNKKLSKHAAFCRKKIKSWVSKGNPNCVAHDALLEAEQKVLEKKQHLAIRNFEVAVLLAGRSGLTHMQALANERYATYLKEVGNLEDAKYRFDQARNLYAEWGATAKVEQLSS